MPSVIIASKNPAKIKAVKSAFKLVFPGQKFTFIGLNVDSGVPDQPLSDAQTRQGALNRVKQAKKHKPQADYWVSLEGGIQPARGLMQSFAWVTIAAKSQINSTRSATFTLPPKIVKLINQGEELGHAMDHLHHRKNSKQQEGAVGILTRGLITRSTLYRQAVILALIPFIPGS